MPGLLERWIGKTLWSIVAISIIHVHVILAYIMQLIMRYDKFVTIWNAYVTTWHNIVLK